MAIKTEIKKKINGVVNSIYPYTSSDIVNHTTNISVKDKLDNTNSFLNSIDHNTFFRGKDLGTVSLSNIDEFLEAHGVASGEFTDLYVGDYITASYNDTNKVFRVAGLDTHWNIGDSSIILNRHHICFVPDSNLLIHSMNTTNTTGQSENENNTSGLKAYAGSDMFQIVLPEVNTYLEAIFGSHLITYREILSSNIDTNATASNFTTNKGATNGWAWYDCKANLMSEVELYGHIVWSSSGHNTGTAKHQLPLFGLEPRYINPTRTWFWLRDVATAAYFCACGGNGNANYDRASGANGVRPRFLIG